MSKFSKLVKKCIGEKTYRIAKPVAEVALAVTCPKNKHGVLIWQINSLINEQSLFLNNFSPAFLIYLSSISTNTTLFLFSILFVFFNIVSK